MKCYLAPMEGITSYIYRNAHKTFFGGVDKYFTPFIVPTQNHRLTSRELNDVLPEHNRRMEVTPQILTNKADDFLWAARELAGLGYEEVNLNLGCPSPTVVTKGRGAGFLKDIDSLERFLDEIFSKCNTAISVKTRLGMSDPEEFYELLELFNQYPFVEMILHSRVRDDFYGNKPNWEMFGYALERSRIPLCYNGDIFSVGSFHEFSKEFPAVQIIMAGRGVIANPGLPGELKNHKSMDKQRLHDFHDMVYEGYRQIMSGDRNPLYKMKELWSYMGCQFEDCQRYLKRIKKAGTRDDYETAVAELFQDRELAEYTAFPVKG